MSRGPWKKNKDIPIQESYPVQENRQKKSIIHYSTYKINHNGELFDSAHVAIEHCCQESIDRCQELCLHKTTVREPEKFGKMVYRGQVVDCCPFCGARYVYKKEPIESRNDWY